MLPDKPSEREEAADRAAFAAIADACKWEAACVRLRAENTRLRAAVGDFLANHPEHGFDGSQLRDALAGKRATTQEPCDPAAASYAAAMRNERRCERAYAAFVAALPERWREDSKLTGHFPPWEQLSGYLKDAVRQAMMSLDEEGAPK